MTIVWYLSAICMMFNQLLKSLFSGISHTHGIPEISFLGPRPIISALFCPYSTNHQQCADATTHYVACYDYLALVFFGGVQSNSVRILLSIYVFE